MEKSTGGHLHFTNLIKYPNPAGQLVIAISLSIYDMCIYSKFKKDELLHRKSPLDRTDPRAID